MTKLNKEIPNVPEFFKTVDTLDSFEKSKLYLRYLATNAKLSYNPTVVHAEVDTLHGWGVPHKTLGNLNFFYLHKNIKDVSYEEFISKKNIVISDHGEEWKKNFWAQRYSVTYGGIYSEYTKSLTRIF